MSMIGIANKIASLSVSANNKSRISRYCFRELLYILSSLSAWWGKLTNYANSRHPINKSIGTIADTEPWPFRSPAFCPWEEDDSADHYNLVANRFGFVAGHQTAYVSSKIHQATKNPLKVRRAEDCPNEQWASLAKSAWVESPHEFDAKNWRAFLALNGFTVEADEPLAGNYYVGIGTDGEFGRVVWFEQPSDKPGYFWVSTRSDKRFAVYETLNKDLCWILIKRKDE